MPDNSARLDYARTVRSSLFWTGSAAFGLIGVGASLYGPALPAFARSYGISAAEAGLLVSAHSLGGLSGLLASAALGAVSARRALAFYAAGAVLLASGLGWAAALAGAFGLGAGHGLVAAVVNRRFLTESGPNGPGMVGLVNAVYGLGAIAGPLLFLALGGAPGPAYALLAVAALAVLALAGGTTAPANPPLAATLAALRRGPAILALGAAAIGLEIGLIGLGPTALVARGLPETRAAELASAFFAVFLAVRVSLLWLAPHIGATALLALGFGSAAALLATATSLPPGLPYVLSGAATGLFFPAFFVAASERLGTDGRAAALIMAAGAVGGILVPAAASALIGLAGAAALFPALAALAAVLCLAALLIARRA